MDRIYIAGKVSGLPINEVKLKFAKAEKKITDAGLAVFNPVAFIANLNHAKIKFGAEPLRDENLEDRKIIMRLCIANLAECNGLCLLPDWQDSKGATIEKAVADMLGIEVYRPNYDKGEPADNNYFI